jgi:hypothetical protein
VRVSRVKLILSSSSRSCFLKWGCTSRARLLSLWWSGLWFARKLGSGLRGKRIKLLFSSLLLTRNIGCGISLRIESSRGLGLGCFVGFSLWVGGEVSIHLTLLFFYKIALIKKKESIKIVDFQMKWIHTISYIERSEKWYRLKMWHVTDAN